ncbi:MAG TPA: type VI secretion system lipoprotein TssJ [Paracoccaceae bacterium]|nr:type VI secretion system lipoprotein TssJ [Paracoccaceae bacterium]
MSVWTKRSVGALGALGLAALVAACSPPPPPEPTVAQINVVAAEGANPDPTGRASPTVVHIYALKTGAPFNIGSYDALTGGEMGDLAETMDRIARFVILPGQETKKVFELPEGTSDVGITAAYRDVATSKWRAQAPVTPNAVTILNARIGANEVTLE